MNLGPRIKKIREIRRMNHKVIAAKMHITPQTYSTIELGENLKYISVKKFCDATNVDPSFLLAEDVPITEENLRFFDNMKGKSFLLCYEQLRQKTEVYGE